MRGLGRIRALLDGGPPTLPGALDAVAERWAALPPRVRFAVASAAAVVILLVAGAGAARSPWGPPVDVFVAARDLPAGHLLSSEDLRRVPWPAELAPTRTVPPEGRTLTVGLPAGTPLGDAHLGDGGLASLLEQDEAAFPLPGGDVAELRAGQRVDLVAGDPGGAGLRLASEARVLTTAGDIAWIAVQRDEAPALAGAAAWGRVVAVPLPTSGQGSGG
ncbi:MAG: hypothetical protein KY437_04800 [Actinobacteria bacterium]|nr:hypothetical protein [Actinomycetota bacterium]